MKQLRSLGLMQTFLYTTGYSRRLPLRLPTDLIFCIFPQILSILDPPISIFCSLFYLQKVSLQVYNHIYRQRGGSFNVLE